MDSKTLAEEIRELSRRESYTDCEMSDVCELLKTLSRIVAGKPVAESFGAPGDWGYNTALGRALAASGEAPADRELRRHRQACQEAYACIKANAWSRAKDTLFGVLQPGEEG